MVIYEFDRNPVEKVRISLNDYKGRQYFDLRVFCDTSEDNNSKWIPTKKGINISLDLLAELKKGVDKALAKAELGEEDRKT